MPIVLGDDLGSSSSFNHYLLVILWSWQVFFIVISDLAFFAGIFGSLVFGEGLVLASYCVVQFSGAIWCTLTIVKEVQLFRKGELGTVVYYHSQVKKSVWVLGAFLLHCVVLAVKAGGVFEGVGQIFTWGFMIAIPFWGALFYAVKIRKEEGKFEEGVVKGLW